MLLPAKMMGFLSWHQFDGLGMSILNPAPPTVSLLYYIQSICSIKKQAMPSIFPIQYSGSLGFTSQYRSKTVANFQFMRSLRCLSERERKISLQKYFLFQLS